MYKKENIVVVIYTPDKVYPPIITLKEAKKRYGDKLKINLKTGIWSWGNLIDKMVGSSYQYGQTWYQQPVGGIFDKTNLDHLNSLSYCCRMAYEKHYRD